MNYLWFQHEIMTLYKNIIELMHDNSSLPLPDFLVR